MRAQSLAPWCLPVVLAALWASPASAVEIVELKDGRLIEAEQVRVTGERLRIRLYSPEGDRTVEYALPFDQVLPEFVYYAWLDGIEPGDAAAQVALGDWARGQGLFSLALARYETAADSDVEVRKQLPKWQAEMRDEEATYRFERAWELFRSDAVHEARVQATYLLANFADSAEAGRTQELLDIIAEREKFLTEQKRQEEIADRARKQHRELDKVVDKMAQADRTQRNARMTSPIDAQRRLRLAAYTYRQCSFRLEDLLPYVEVDDLRQMVGAILDDLAQRRVSTFLKLGDLRLLGGDYTGALDAAHEVFAIDPENAKAKDLRDRVLTGPPVAPVATGYGVPGLVWYHRYLARRRCITYPTPLGYLRPRCYAYPVPARSCSTFGISVGIGRPYGGGLIWPAR